MDIVFTVVGQIVVDDQADLLDVNAAGQQVGGDEDTARAGAEFPHDGLAFALIHVSVLRGGGRKSTREE